MESPYNEIHVFELLSGHRWHFWTYMNIWFWYYDAPFRGSNIMTNWKKTRPLEFFTLRSGIVNLGMFCQKQLTPPGYGWSWPSLPSGLVVFCGMRSLGETCIEDLLLVVLLSLNFQTFSMCATRLRPMLWVVSWITSLSCLMNSTGAALFACM